MTPQVQPPQFNDALQYGALGLVWLIVVMALPLIFKTIGKLLDRIDKLGDRFEGALDRQTDSMAAQSRASDERLRSTLADIHRDVRDGRCRYGRTPNPSRPDAE